MHESGDSGRAGTPKGTNEEESQQDSGRRSDFANRGKTKPQTHCPKCREPLGNELEVAAFGVLKDAGERFDTSRKQNRAIAFDELASTIALNMAILVASRVVSLADVHKMLLSSHTMLGAPKLESDGSGTPIEKLANWLNDTEDTSPVEDDSEEGNEDGSPS